MRIAGELTLGGIRTLLHDHEPAPPESPRPSKPSDACARAVFAEPASANTTNPNASRCLIFTLLSERDGARAVHRVCRERALLNQRILLATVEQSARLADQV